MCVKKQNWASWIPNNKWQHESLDAVGNDAVHARAIEHNCCNEKMNLNVVVDIREFCVKTASIIISTFVSAAACVGTIEKTIWTEVVAELM